MRLEKVVIYDGVEYTLATINNATARQISLFKDDKGQQLTPRQSNERLTVASLIAGGLDQQKAQELVDGIPVFLDTAWDEFIAAMLHVNGLKIVKMGEEQAEASPAA